MTECTHTTSIAGTTPEVVGPVHMHTAGVGLACEPIISTHSLGARRQIQGWSASCGLCCHVYWLVDSTIDLHHSSGKPLRRSVQGFLTQLVCSGSFSLTQLLRTRSGADRKALTQRQLRSQQSHLDSCRHSALGSSDSLEAGLE